MSEPAPAEPIEPVNVKSVFGENPANYDKARIGYYEPFVQQIIEDAGFKHSPLQIVDIGAGTGQLGRVFLGLNHHVTFVEPSQGSIDHLHRIYDSNPNARIVHASAENMEAIDAHSADIIVMGDASHWIDPACLPELRRVLKPDGKMILFSRVLSPENDITHKLHNLLLEHVPEYLDSTNQLVRDFDNTRKRQGQHLVAPDEREWRGYAMPHPYSQDELVTFLKSLSFSKHAIDRDEAGFRRDVITPLWEFAKHEGLLSPEGHLQIYYEINALHGPARTRNLGEERGTLPVKGASRS